MERIKTVQALVDEILRASPPQVRRAGYIHIYGVAQACAMLAMKRGQDVELATVAGLMHDLHTYRIGNPEGHAHQGAALARELLGPTGLFSEEEMEQVAGAIYAHSDKAGHYEPFVEVLIDADVLQHCLVDPTQKPAPHEAERFARLKAELGLGV